MKTPREILLVSHADAQAEVNTIRARVVADLRPAEASGWLVTAWRELVWQPRGVWSGLAAVWVGIVVGNAILGHPPVRQATSTATVNVAEGLRQKRALYAEFGLLRSSNTVAQIRRPGPQSRLHRPNLERFVA